MRLTTKQAVHFVTDGYLQVSGALPKQKVEQALRAINHSIGIVGKTGADPEAFRQDSFCSELRSAEVLLNLFNGTQVKALAEGLLGHGKVQALLDVQVAPIFPLPPLVKAAALAGHLDATGTGTNGNARGSYVRDFSLIAVIYLVDVPAESCGNFTVWPGSHVETRDFFLAHGHEILVEGDPDIPLQGKPRMLTGKAGDIVMAHHLLQHVGGPNTSPQVRHALIGRMAHVDVSQHGYGAFTDMWREFEGVSCLAPV